VAKARGLGAAACLEQDVAERALQQVNFVVVGNKLKLPRLARKTQALPIHAACAR
jgi:hypothetical protein